MSNLAKLEFVALDITGKNFLSWILDVEIHLDANGLGNTIKEGNTTSTQEKAKAMIFLRRHLHEGLKVEYLTVKDPLILWKSLKERYVGKNILHFHASNVLLQQQYREKGFMKYSELISCLLVVEQNNEFLMKNHEAHPTGSAPFPEVNATSYHPYNGQGRHRGRGRDHGRGRGRGRNNYNHDYHSKSASEYQKGENTEKNDKSAESKDVQIYAIVAA
ncbi:hypothetical protein ZIOFF_055268 [Zingiber officinale]|uniref:Zinc finger, CCHC-type n=1 Tax=Zingiber officinale TaxID=94328 RepID=A0A8J5FBA5_ZINOF|nr:hypothetical protein ZIOFF_055268 [Zingiber officinale]